MSIDFIGWWTLAIHSFKLLLLIAVSIPHKLFLNVPGDLETNCVAGGKDPILAACMPIAGGVPSTGCAFWGERC